MVKIYVPVIIVYPDAEPVITSTSAISFADQSFGNAFSASLESTLTNITNDPIISNPDEMRTLYIMDLLVSFLAPLYYCATLE
jgi:hypothetical protein